MSESPNKVRDLLKDLAAEFALHDGVPAGVTHFMAAADALIGAARREMDHLIHHSSAPTSPTTPPVPVETVPPPVAVADEPPGAVPIVNLPELDDATVPPAEETEQ